MKRELETNKGEERAGQGCIQIHSLPLMVVSKPDRGLVILSSNLTAERLSTSPGWVCREPNTSAFPKAEQWGVGRGSSGTLAHGSWWQQGKIKA